jgi:hypothetical protein
MNTVDKSYVIPRTGATGLGDLVESAPLRWPHKEPKLGEPKLPIHRAYEHICPRRITPAECPELFETIEFDPPPSFDWPPFRPWKRDGGLG